MTTDSTHLGPAASVSAAAPGAKPAQRPPVRRPFGRALVDRFTDWVGTPLHKLTPLFGHAYDNSIPLRTLLGNAYFALVAAGAFLGAWAVENTHGVAVPPVLWLTLAITALGIFDAFSGLVATIVFTGGVVFSGHLFSSHLVTGPAGTQGMLYAFTGILSMAFFWFIGPQLPRRIRLLGFNSIKNTFQRRYVMIGDFFVVTLLMILILGSMPIFIPIFTGADKQSLTQVVLQNHADAVKWVVGIAAFLRVGLDEIVHAKFQSIPKTVGRTRGPLGRWAMRLVGSLIALALVWEVIGTLWQWPVVWLLLVSLDGLSALGERFLRPGAIYRYVPRYLFRIVTLLLFDEYAARELSGKLVSGEELLAWLVLLLVIVIGVYAILDGPDDETEKEKPATWLTRLIGILVVIALFVLSQDIWAVPATPYANPSAVAVSASGLLYIADSGNNRVIEVATNGDRARVGASLSGPSGVAVDENAATPSIYIADTGHNQVVRAETKPVEALVPASQFGHVAFADAATTQSPVGTGFSHPTGLATDAKGRLFVADTGNNRIVEILPTGQQFNFATGLAGPLAVAADAFGQIFVADTGAGEVVRYEVGANGADDGSKVVARGLDEPAGVAADAQGNFFVSDSGRDRVYEYLADGRRLRVRGQFADPRGLAVDGEGHLYVADAGDGQVILSEPVYAPRTSAIGPAATATAAALGPDGSSYVVSAAAGTLEHVGAAGATTLDTQLNRPSGVAWSLATHRLYVSQSGNGTVERVDPATGSLRLLAHGLVGVTTLVADAYGGLYALEPGAGRIVAISAQGRVRTVVRRLPDPTSLVEDAYGYLDVTIPGTNPHGGQVWRIDPSGKAYVLARSLHDPTSIAADLNGDVFYVEHGTQRVWEERGLLGAQIVWQGTGASSDPAVIVSDHAGNLTVFPLTPGHVIHLHRSTTFYPI
jgi:sugar lactone lactonase YvrE